MGLQSNFFTMAPEQQQQCNLTLVTVPVADFPSGLYVRTGTTYSMPSENFFEDQYFGEDDLPAESVVSSSPASSPGPESTDTKPPKEFIIKFCRCVKSAVLGSVKWAKVANATVHDDAPKPSLVHQDSYVPTKD